MDAPHSDPKALAAALGCPLEEIEALTTTLSAEELLEALMAALERSFPGYTGPESLPGRPEWYDAAGEPAQIAARLAADRAAGLLPLLVSADIEDPEGADERLVALHEVASRDGVWLHAAVRARHKMRIDALDRADSVTFEVPSAEGGRARVFVTRHPAILDAPFREALGAGATGEGRGGGK
jgi:hypothetical protein